MSLVQAATIAAALTALGVPISNSSGNAVITLSGSTAFSACSVGAGGVNYLLAGNAATQRAGCTVRLGKCCTPPRGLGHTRCSMSLHTSKDMKKPVSMGTASLRLAGFICT